uniref:Uncharacterized protein n=1 Tax=Knipowitschia caucasica TaxID=637954 RepID=A0AAV2JRW8_KNICA
MCSSESPAEASPLVLLRSPSRRPVPVLLIVPSGGQVPGASTVPEQRPSPVHLNPSRRPVPSAPQSQQETRIPVLSVPAGASPVPSRPQQEASPCGSSVPHRKPIPGAPQESQQRPSLCSSSLSRGLSLCSSSPSR